jgi:hypothetical protein
MGKPYSQDLRERVIAAVDTGTGAYVAAPLFRVSGATPPPLQPKLQAPVACYNGELKPYRGKARSYSRFASALRAASASIRFCSSARRAAVSAFSTSGQSRE